MHAMVLNEIGTPLVWTELPDPVSGPGQFRVKVTACGVWPTDLYAIDFGLPHPQTSINPGREIVGRIDCTNLDRCPFSHDWTL